MKVATLRFERTTCTRAPSRRELLRDRGPRGPLPDVTWQASRSPSRSSRAISRPRPPDGRAVAASVTAPSTRHRPQTCPVPPQAAGKRTPFAAERFEQLPPASAPERCAASLTTTRSRPPRSDHQRRPRDQDHEHEAHHDGVVKSTTPEHRLKHARTKAPLRSLSPSSQADPGEPQERQRHQADDDERDPEPAQAVGYVAVAQLLANPGQRGHGQRPAEARARRRRRRSRRTCSSRSTMKSDPPRMAQLTVISGRKIPSASLEPPG